MILYDYFMIFSIYYIIYIFFNIINYKYLFIFKKQFLFL